MADVSAPRKGGSDECPLHCSDCGGEPGEHHFSEAMLESAETSEDGAEHDAAKAGVEVWHECTRSAWMEYDLDGELA